MLQTLKQNFSDGKSGEAKRTSLANVVLYTFLVLSFLSSLLNLLMILNESLFSFARDVTPSLTKNHLLILSALGLPATIGLFAVLKWRIWGVYLYFAAILLALVVNLTVIDVGFSLVSLVGPVIVFLAIYFGIKRNEPLANNA